MYPVAVSLYSKNVTTCDSEMWTSITARVDALSRLFSASVPGVISTYRKTYNVHFFIYTAALLLLGQSISLLPI